MSMSLSERAQSIRVGMHDAIRSFALSALGAVRFAIEPIYGGLGTILAFHRVVESQPARRVAWVSELEVTTATLEELLGWATRSHRAVLSLDEIHEGLVHGTLRHPFVAFTFDDGYRDNLTLALPLFEAHHVPLALYLTTDFPDHRTVFWWYGLEEALLDGDRLDFEYAGRHHLHRSRTPAEREEAFAALASQFDSADPDALRALASAALGDERMARLQATLPLDWDDVRTLARSPLATIGAHTVTHPVLSELPPDRVRGELVDSRQRIEVMIGQPVRHLAYPYGTFPQVTARELEVGRGCGFDTATTARAANLFPEHARHLESLPRYVYGGESVAHLCRDAFTGAAGALRYRGRRVVTA